MPWLVYARICISVFKTVKIQAPDLRSNQASTSLQVDQVPQSSLKSPYGPSLGEVRRKVQKDSSVDWTLNQKEEWQEENT